MQITSEMRQARSERFWNSYKRMQAKPKGGAWIHELVSSTKREENLASVPDWMARAIQAIMKIWYGVDYCHELSYFETMREIIEGVIFDNRDAAWVGKKIGGASPNEKIRIRILEICGSEREGHYVVEWPPSKPLYVAK